MPDMKRVSTRDFLRNINSMDTEPVEVYSRTTLKGVWYPAFMWNTPSSEPATLGADVEAPSIGRSLGASRPTKPQGDPA